MRKESAITQKREGRRKAQVGRKRKSKIQFETVSYSLPTLPTTGNGKELLRLAQDMGNLRRRFNRVGQRAARMNEVDKQKLLNVILKQLSVTKQRVALYRFKMKFTQVKHTCSV